jgi:hypothetical protein
MSNLELYTAISKLDDAAKAEVKDFADFLLEKSKKIKKKKHPKAGFMKGKIKMLPGFDDPLEDFKEYIN